jgi:hypothetical protein
MLRESSRNCHNDWELHSCYAMCVAHRLVQVCLLQACRDTLITGTVTVARLLCLCVGPACVFSISHWTPSAARDVLSPACLLTPTHPGLRGHDGPHLCLDIHPQVCHAA